MKIKLILPLLLLIETITSCDGQTSKTLKNEGEKKVTKNAQVSTSKEIVLKDVNFNTAYHQYIDVKTALVESNPEAAQKGAHALQLTLAKIKPAEKAMKTALSLFETLNLDKQRTIFTDLSNEMILLVKNSEFNKGEIYIEFCPMANDQKGGYWLSNEKEIANPYFGDQMLHCGSVEETIK